MFIPSLNLRELIREVALVLETEFLPSGPKLPVLGCFKQSHHLGFRTVDGWGFTARVCLVSLNCQILCEVLCRKSAEEDPTVVTPRFG